MEAPLLASFRAFVAREKLFTQQDKLLLACSGGRDSTVLAHLLRAEGYDFSLVHMNFGLRGEASDGDEAFVRELARTLDAGYSGKAVNVKAAAKAGESTQMTARRLRYAYFEEVRAAGGYDALLTAHHADDNLETSLINLLRGTGIHGLAGIQPRAGWLRRPLLECSREEIGAYAASQSLRWREDASNATDDYLRNRIRHHLTPLLFNDFGLTPSRWIKTAANLRAALTIYNTGISYLHRDRCESRGDLWIVYRNRGWQPGELRTFLHEQVHVYQFTAEQVRQMLTVPGQRTLQTDLATVYITPDRLTFELKSDAEHRSPPPVEINSLPSGVLRRGYYHLSLEVVDRPAELDEDGVQYLAPPPLPLHLRPRQPGDRFQPLGMRGKTKKVKDYLIDRKIPVWLRDRLYVLTDATGEIMALPGLCVAEGHKVLPEHKTVLRITYG